MKIVLTGATGLIGGGVLTECLTNPSITSITTLTRRPLPVTHPKLTQITHTDFTTYSPELLSSLADATACVFALGLAMPKTAEDGQRINQAFPLAAAKALLPNSNNNFRFVYISGALVEKDQTKKLWLVPEARKMRGRTELELLKLADDPSGKQVYVCRPGFVGAKGGSVKDTLIGLVMPVVGVDVLAKAIVELAVNGAGAKNGSRCVEMDELVRLGKGVK
jgi:hypothetical protein